MGITKTKTLQLIKPNIGQERGQWGRHLNANADILDQVVGLNRVNILSWSESYVDVAGTKYVFGFENDLVLSGSLTTSPITVAVGASKLSLDVKAGSDLSGTVTLTGDSRHSSTGEILIGDTEILAVNGIGVYNSKRAWVGSVVLTPTSLSISDLDVRAVALLDTLGQPFEMLKLRLLATSTTSGLTLTAKTNMYQQSGSSLKVSEILGGKLDISSTPTGVNKWDLTLEPEVGVLDSDKDEGMVTSLVLTGAAPGDWKDLEFSFSYRIRPNKSL